MEGSLDSKKYTGKILSSGKKRDERHNRTKTPYDRLLISTKSYITIITLDGQIKINDNALYYLKTWSQRINMLPLLTDGKSNPYETISTFNVSTSYLMRLICIAIASYECYQFSTDPYQEQFIEKKIKQILRMFDAHNHDEFTSCYNEELDMIMDEDELTLIKFMKSIGFTKPIEFSNNLTLPRIRSSRYILFNVSDGQIKIPYEALEYLKIWFGKIRISTTLSVSKSYLMRLICIAIASYQCNQFSTYPVIQNLVEKKKEQILRMFDAHNRDEMTSFYNDEMEINEHELTEFMQSIGLAKPIDYSGKWILPASFLEKVRVQIDTMDPHFTLPQYTVIAILSYFEYLNNTHPEKVEGLNIEVSLLENPVQYRLTTWIPESTIKIGNISIELYINKIISHEIEYHSMPTILFSLLYTSRNTRTQQEKLFLQDIVTVFDKCWNDPNNRNWSILKDELEM